MSDLLKVHGYPTIPIDPKDFIHCNSTNVISGMDASEEDYGGQTEICSLCGRAWSCEYGGANQKVNNVQCNQSKV